MKMENNTKELPKKARGMMHIQDWHRTEYGALFAIFQKQDGAQFLVPVQHLLDLIKTLYGTRHTELVEKPYYKTPRQPRETYTLDK